MSQEEQEGKLPHATAVEGFRSLLPDVTFGKDGYVFAYRMDALLVLQPQEPENEGKNLIDRHAVAVAGSRADCPGAARRRHPDRAAAA